MKRAERILEKNTQLSEVSENIQELLSSKSYLSKSDIQKWLKSFPEIGNELAHPFFDPEFLPQKYHNVFSLFDEIRRSSSQLVAECNKKFVSEAKVRYSDLFSKLEKYPLTNEQITASVIDEDRSLLIAAAGSGKSSTIVAKVIYLLESKLARPDQLLVLAYNKDAQFDIDSRLKALKGIVPNYDGTVRANSFHTLYIKRLIYRTFYSRKMGGVP